MLEIRILCPYHHETLTQPVKSEIIVRITALVDTKRRLGDVDMPVFISRITGQNESSSKRQNHVVKIQHKLLEYCRTSTCVSVGNVCVIPKTK